MPSALILVENASVPADPRVWAECMSLRRAGWAVTVVCPQGRRRDTEAYENLDGVSIHRFCASESEGGALGYLREYATALMRISSLVRRLSSETRFDVVEACNPPDLLLLTTLRLRRRGVATIFDHHDLSPELFVAKYGRRLPFQAVLAMVERMSFRLADVVLASNESFRAVALTRGGMNPNDVFVVRNGPDPDVFRPVAPDNDLKRGAAHLIGYVGLMGSQDGVDVALEALAALRGREDWHAIFVGDGDALPAARELASTLGIDDRVTFTGFVSDRQQLVRMIATCDVCLSPEPRNPLNEQSTLIKVAEYMAVGKPVVAFALTETRRTADTAAVYAKRDDAFALADEIAALLDDPERRAELGSAARLRIQEGLSWETSERSLLAAYDRALALGARRAPGRS